MDKCINYTYSLYELLIPSLKILQKFCSSIDKTNLFLMSLLRLFIIYRLFFYLNNKELILFSINNPIKFTFFMICLIYLLINIAYIVIIFYKKPDYDQRELDQKSDLIAIALSQNKVKAEST